MHSVSGRVVEGLKVSVGRDGGVVGQDSHFVSRDADRLQALRLRIICPVVNLLQSTFALARGVEIYGLAELMGKVLRFDWSLLIGLFIKGGIHQFALGHWLQFFPVKRDQAHF